MSLERIRQDQRRWLAKHDLLDRPWFILGSAPNPTVPAAIANRAALVCINNAGATAARLGLPPAALTFRNSNKEWHSVTGLELPVVLWMSDRNAIQVWWERVLVSKSRVGAIRTLHPGIRQEITTHLLGNDLSAVGNMHKTSTGIFAVIYGLFVGVPAITLSGFSLAVDGYSYGSQPGIQRHRDEDLFALQVIGERYGIVNTSEPEVARSVGLSLHAA